VRQNGLKLSKVRRLLPFLLLLYYAWLPGQEQPPVDAFEPDVYDAGNQNWMLSQSERQFIYVANNEGLLEYNGMQWTLFPSPNETIIRAVKVIEGKVYTGCYQEFGVWAPNAHGGLEYQSLSQSVAGQMVADEHFWNILSHEGQLIFQSLDQLFIYDLETEAIEVFRPADGVDKLFEVRQDLIFSDARAMLYRLEGGKALPLLKSALPSRIIYAWDTREGIGVVTDRHGRWLVRPDGTTEKLQDPLRMQNTRVYSALRLENGQLALGTISNGIFILNASGQVAYQIIQTDGLTNNTVLSLYEDASNNLWAGTDNGISCVNLSSPFRKYTDQNGVLGTVYTAVEYNGRLYFGTNQGLFTQVPGRTEFALVEGTTGQVWSLFQYEGTLFCGHDQGTFIINGLTSKQVFGQSGTWQFVRVPGRPDLILQGNYYGLSLLEQSGGEWSFRNKVEGFNLSSRFIALPKEQEAYISHEYKGVFGLMLDKDYRQVVARMDYPEPVKGKNAGLATFDEKVFYYSREGLFALKGFEAGFERYEALSEELAGEAFESGKMSVDPEGRLWFFTDNALIYYTKGTLSEDWELHSVPVQADLINAMSGYENITWLKPDHYLIGTADGYLVFNFEDLPVLDHQVYITHVLSHKVDRMEQALPVSGSPTVPFSYNNLSFEFAVPTYSRYFIPEFQYRLLGLYDSWSEWSHDATLSFRNLPFGHYTLEIQSRIGQQHSSNVLTYDFVISRPWYWSVGAMIIYTVLGLLLIYFTHRAYTRYYQRQKEELQAESQLRLEAQQKQAELELFQVRNEQLQKDIDSKNRELAISTMSLVKKNELLHQIKSALKQEGSPDENIRRVVRTIDKNTDEAETWNFFKEAFENADQDFFKKVQDKHPKLTHNDLKLCAYLRLNLSSKEIAPLLNISVRSVEVKRYRLRKKMALEHDEGLVEYILSI